MKQIFSVPYYSILKYFQLVYKYGLRVGIILEKTNEIITITKVRDFFGYGYRSDVF